MTKLSKYEKETIINWNEAEDTASIYTFNADLKRRLAEFSRKYPQLCRLERSTTEGSVIYVMDKSRLSIRLVPPYLSLIHISGGHRGRFLLGGIYALRRHQRDIQKFHQIL